MERRPLTRGRAADTADGEPTTMRSDKARVFDPYATAEAIRILDQKRVEAAPLPAAMWRFLYDASRHLDDELTSYFRDPSQEKDSNRRIVAA